MMHWLKAIKTALVLIHQASYAPPFLMRTYPLTPFLRGRGNADGFCEGWCDGFNRMMRWLKAIKTALVLIHQASYAPPFLVGTGVAYNERSE